MAYRLLADLVVLLHFGFVFLVLFGGLFALRWRRAVLLHAPAALWGVWIELSGDLCPLTPLENWLRAQSGQRGYAGGFVEHYLLPTLYPAGLTREVQFVLAGVAAAANVIVYALVWRQARRPGP